MKKLANDRNCLIEDELEGFSAAYSKLVILVKGTHIISRRQPADKVRFIIGNGGGHEPAVIGWVGKGMFDANIVGEVFTAPSAEKILQGLEYVDNGKPILLAVQNHAGDVMNAGMAVEMARVKGIDVRSVLFYDDIASAPKGFECERRGMAGMLFYAKIVGAFLEQDGGIDEAINLFERVRDNTRTFSVAITTCTHPVSGMEMFDLGPDEIELGMGVHGEGGMNRRKLPASRDLVRIMSDILIEDFGYSRGDEILVLINGAGSTTMMELYIFFKDLNDYLTELGIGIHGVKVGNYLTTQELSGVSLSFCKTDRQMKELWDAPCNAPDF
jgi:dihydroxyacetone kinase-like protein